MRGDGENESCRIRFGSETREEPAKRRVLQTAGRFITCCSLYVSRVSFNTLLPLLSAPTHHAHTCRRWRGEGAGNKDAQRKGEKLVRKDGKDKDVISGQKRQI